MEKYFCQPKKNYEDALLLIHDYLLYISWIFTSSNPAAGVLNFWGTSVLFSVCIATAQLKGTIWKQKSICQVQKKFFKKIEQRAVSNVWKA